MYSPPRLALQPDTPGTQSSLQCRWDEGEPDIMGRRPGGCENEVQLEQKRGLTTQIASMVRETRGGLHSDPDLQRGSSQEGTLCENSFTMEAVAKEDGWADKCPHTAKERAGSSS